LLKQQYTYVVVVIVVISRNLKFDHGNKTDSKALVVAQDLSLKRIKKIRHFLN